MLKELKFKRYLKYIPLLLIMFMSMLMITIPKTYARNSDAWMSYVNTYHKGKIVNIVSGDFGILITEGPAKDIDPNNDANPGLWYFASNSDWLGPHATWTTGTIVEWTPEMAMWMAVEDKQPVINGETAFVTNIDKLITIPEIMLNIEAWDNEDGNITHLIQIDSANSTYNTSITTLGTYDLKLFVLDSSGNRADLTVHVLVKDIAVPVITGTKTYTQSYTTKKDVGAILAALSATDNYDTVNPIVKVKTDGYSANYNKIGTYNIVFNATDTSGNEGLYTVIVNVIDDIKPTFTGPTSIVKGQSQTLVLADITSQVSVSDFIDKTVSFKVKSDGYTGKGHLVGSYSIILEAIDTSGNVATHTITINVQDNIPPVFYVDNFFIHVDDVVLLTRQDIIDLLVASGQLTIQATTTINFSLNEYEGNETVPGIYGIVVNSSSIDGTAKQISLAVEVESTSDNGDITVEPNKNIFTDIWNGIKSGWNWLKTPTKEAGKFYNGYYVGIGIGVICLLILIFKRKKPYYKKRW